MRLTLEGPTSFFVTRRSHWGHSDPTFSFRCCYFKNVPKYEIYRSFESQRCVE